MQLLDDSVSVPLLHERVWVPVTAAVMSLTEKLEPLAGGPFRQLFLWTHSSDWDYSKKNARMKRGRIDQAN